MPCPKRLLILRASGPPGTPQNGELLAAFRPLQALGVQVIQADSVDDAAREIAEHAVDVLVVTPAAVHPGSGQPGTDGLTYTASPPTAPSLAAPTLTALARRLERNAGVEVVAARSLPPVLVVADPVDPIPAVVAGRRLLDSPAWDIVRGDAPPEELLLRAEHLVAQAESSAELSRVRYQASHDDRTGLLRPGPFDERLRAHFSAAGRHRLELALVLVDLDRFGDVNKRYDHTVGDELIARAGSVIQMSLRAEDVGARIGGDEFALILPYTQKVAAARVVSRLTGRFRALSGPPPRHFRAKGSGGSSMPGEPESITVSASLGFETFDGFDIDTPEELRRRAERALHTAKSRGGNQGVYYRNIAPRSADVGQGAGGADVLHPMRRDPRDIAPTRDVGPTREVPPPSDEHTPTRNAGPGGTFMPKREQRRG